MRASGRRSRRNRQGRWIIIHGGGGGGEGGGSSFTQRRDFALVCIAATVGRATTVLGDYWDDCGGGRLRPVLSSLF
eukprot:scaffold247817_cov116-Cyclotella_meneghiniana.AAC.1